MVILHALLRLKLVGNFARIALSRVRSCSVQVTKEQPFVKKFRSFSDVHSSLECSFYNNYRTGRMGNDPGCYTSQQHL